MEFEIKGVKYRTANPSATLTRGPPPLSGEVGYAPPKAPLEGELAARKG